jgi:transposase InsO family protein
MIANDAKARSLAVGKVAKTSGQVGNGLHSFDLISAPLDLVGADAHHVDCFGTIEIEGPAGPQLVPISRLWIYVVVDFESRAVCGYAASFRTEPTASQIELALDMATKPWQPRTLNMGTVRYKEGAGFPMGCVDGFVFAPAALRMDSAAQSFANRIVHRVRRRFGCAVSWSAVGAWYHNDVVERFFGLLERFGLHRLPTSVGSGPADPRRTESPRFLRRLNTLRGLSHEEDE